MDRTNSGSLMRPNIRQRIVEVLADARHARATRPQQAKLAGVSLCTLKNYLTPELRAEVERLKFGELEARDLVEVDRAMWLRAKEGSVAAARLIYARVGAVREEDAPTLEEIEATLAAYARD